MKEEANGLKVEEIFDQIIADKKWSKQDFAAYIGYDSSKMSQKFGAHWDAHWRVFVKLLPDLVRLKIIDPNTMCVMSDKCDPDKSSQNDSNKLKTQGNTAEDPPPRTDIMSPLLYGSFILQ